MNLPRQALAITGAAAVLFGGGTAAQAMVQVNPAPCATTTIPQVSGYMATDFATHVLYVAQGGTDNSPPAVQVVNEATNTVTATIPVPSNPGPLAVNSKTNTIYVPVGSNVLVISGQTNTVVHTIRLSSQESATDVTVNPVTGRIYVIATNRNDSFGRLRVFAAGTYAGNGDIRIGKEARAPRINVKTDTIYVASGETFNTEDISVVNGHTNKVTASVPLEGSLPGSVPAIPDWTAVNQVTNRLYVYSEDGNGVGWIEVINGSTNTIQRVIKLKGGFSEGITNVQVAPSTNTIYATAANLPSHTGTLNVIDGNTGKVTSTLTMRTKGEQWGFLQVDSGLGTMYISDGFWDSTSNSALSTRVLSTNCS
jgi:DNA-binding beta-propeller fold protein YncE